SGNSVKFLPVSDSGSEQTIQFSVPKNSRETYTLGVNVGQDPGAVENYTLSLDSIQSGIDVFKSEDIGKTTRFSVATYDLKASFDSFDGNVATVTVTNNTAATVTLNLVSLSAFEDSLGGTVVALRVPPSKDVGIVSGNTKTIRLSVEEVRNAETMDIVFLPDIEATVSGNAVRLSWYRAEDNVTSPFQTHTRGIRRSFSANTSVDPSMVYIDRIEVKKDNDVIGELLNGDAVTPNSEFVIHMLNPSMWEFVQLESVSAPHSGSDQDYDADTGQLATRTFKGSGSFSLRVTPTDGSPFSIPIRFLMSRSLAVSDPLLYPNPYNTAVGSPLTMSINTTTPSDVDITLYDMRGRAVVAHNQSVPLGYTNVTIPGTGQLASGMYIAYVVIKSGGDSVKKVVRLAVY
ncbi:MAG: T9SS type A sorting domain-containing protein, partial [bacterium]|nr:T9SS type A sorting domain-containing protein [bacterium]